MAKNYTFAEAVAIINEGKDLEAIVDIGKRFPILLHKVTVVTTKAGQDFVDLVSYLPEHLTANKVNTAMKANIGESGDDAEAGEPDPEVKESAKEAKKTATKAKKSNAGETETGETSEGSDWASMSSNALYQELKKRGLTKGRKFSKKADMIAALEQYEANGGAEAEEAEEAEEATEATGTYEGKSAMELFKECKKRGIKAEPKKPAKFYIDLLTKDDAKNAEAEEDESDDWDDEEEVKETKTAKKSAPKTEKKAAKKAEPKEESEDDDWDI